jgi:hypothetical protein
LFVEIKWLGDEVGTVLAGDEPALVVVVPGEGKEAEETAARMHKLVSGVNKELRDWGSHFLLGMDGTSGPGKIPVFFVREFYYVGDEQHVGLVRVVPCGYSHSPLYAAKKKLAGVESLDKNEIIQLVMALGLVKTGDQRALEAAKEEGVV